MNIRENDSSTPETKELRWKLIAATWAFAAVLHILTFKWLAPPSVLGWTYLAATFLLIAKPSSWGRFCLFLGITAGAFLIHYSKLSNHLVLEFWLVLAGIAIGMWHFLSGKHSKERRLFKTIAPLARAFYGLLFLFSFFAKLNSSFFDPDSSCAAHFMRSIVESYGLTEILGEWAATDLAGHGAIGLTLACELSVPLLLFWRRTLRAGMVLATIFHLLMGLVPVLGISSFSAFSWVLLLFFLPETSWVALEQRMQRCRDRSIEQTSKKRILKRLLLGGVAALVWWQMAMIHPGPWLAIVFWLAGSAPFIVLILQSLRRIQGQAPTEDKPWLCTRPWPLNLLIIPVIILGTLPYLGLQTRGSFTIFSNLRILGDQPNHFIVPASWKIHEPELIKIINTNHPTLKEFATKNLLITEHELRRFIHQEAIDFFLICEIEGEAVWLQRSGGKDTDHALMKSAPFLQSHFIRYKPVSTAKLAPCAW